MNQWVAIALLAGGALWWWWTMQVREAAVAAARRACQAFRVQFLDDSVVLRQSRPRRDARGRLCLRRVYAFEFAPSGGERRLGHVTLLGRQVLDVHLDAVGSEDQNPGRLLR